MRKGQIAFLFGLSVRVKVFELQASMNVEWSDKTTTKTENQNRNEKNRRQIVDFIADNGISDAKTVSKAIRIIF